MSSGPRTGFGEINLPARQNGSSIMPGKVNPVIPEVVSQVAYKVTGNDVAIAMAVEAGQMELNAFDSVVIDEAASTVFLTDPNVRLDVGAVAKGWAAQRAAETAPEGFLISVGGNICATGPKDESGSPWIVAVQDPDNGEEYLHTLELTKGNVVTSGDYQRTFTVDGKAYHHIIDPDTLYPGEYWRSVTVVCADSGTADALSTALFLLPEDEGQALLESYGAEALWVGADGSVTCSSGFRALIRD